MHLSKVLPFFAGLAAALPTDETMSPRATLAGGPSNSEVQFGSVAFAGSGCPAGSVSGQLSTDLTTITLLYSKFIAQSGSGLSATENRKNCQLNVKIKYPSGWQFSVFKADYRGYAALKSGDTGTCKATYYFSGDSQQVSSTLTIRGPYDDNYQKTDQFGVTSTVWSPCGVEGLLNINSEVRISAAQSSNSNLLTVDSTDLSFKQIHHLQWQKCNKKA